MEQINPFERATMNLVREMTEQPDSGRPEPRFLQTDARILRAVAGELEGDTCGHEACRRETRESPSRQREYQARIHRGTDAGIADMVGGQQLKTIKDNFFYLSKKTQKEPKKVKGKGHKKKGNKRKEAKEN